LPGANALSDFSDHKSPVEKARKVRDMFGAIAGRYDFLNHCLSANIDRRWRQICVRELSNRVGMVRPRILDIGCGTADLSLVFSRLGPVIGCDFCHPMLQVGAQKILSDHRAWPISLLEADALGLPFAEASFDIVVSAFVLRNLADMDRGLQEMRRVLRPGGFLGILDFGMPRIPLLGALYRWYFMRILPKVGKLISGVDGPYGYLPASVQAFPPVEELQGRVERAGFANAEYQLLTGGIAILLMGKAV
jgi:demethylmenaquinone methyltransferase / 2-methoxy-6-polyprenyl-1,4-benzoquinol methylase